MVPGGKGLVMWWYSVIGQPGQQMMRVRDDGKTGKQALIAVCNKLLKQVFAVAKNNSLYQPNYCSANP